MTKIWKRWCRLCAGEENVENSNNHGKYRDLFSYIEKCLPQQIENNKYPNFLCKTCYSNLFDFNSFIRKCEKVQLLFNVLIENPSKNEDYYLNLRDKYLHKPNKIFDEVVKSDSVKVENNLIEIPEFEIKIKEENDEDDWADCVTKEEDHFYDDDISHDSKSPLVDQKYEKPSKVEGTRKSRTKQNKKETTKRPRKRKNLEEGGTENYPEKKKKKRKCPKKKVPYDIAKDELTCPICKETFPVHNVLIRHMSVHFPNFICDICAKVFDSKFRLTKHVSTHRAKLFKCDICGKFLKGEAGLKKHIRFIHTEPEADKMYKCAYCPERFKAYISRSKHLLDVHNIKQRQFKCQQCEKTFTQNCGLTRHIKRIHLQEKPVPCPVCDDRFFSKSDMLDHMKKHSSERKFQCTTCTKAFKGRFSLTEHMKIHRNESFVCSYCGKSFLYKYSLKFHMRKTHEKSAG